MPSPVLLAAHMNDPWMPTTESGIKGHFYQEGERQTELPSDWYSILSRLGVTMLQVDSEHHTTNETMPGVWDWALYDRLFEAIRNGGFQAIFFPHWHWPPDWYEDSDEFIPCRCLEHDEAIPCISPWSPHAKSWFERCINAMAEHYDGPDGVAGIYLGIHGDWGEAMYPLGGEVGVACLEYGRGLKDAHWHPDFWCNDPCARDDFRRTAIRKYGSLTALNDVWQSQYDNAAQLDFPRTPDPDNPRPWLDFIEWYYDSMTSLSAMVAELYRRRFPNLLLMLPLGGGTEALVFGQDNTGLPKAMKPFNVAIRSTASGSTQSNRQYSTAEKFQRNYPILKRIASACKFYGNELWLEPPWPPKMGRTATVTKLFEVLSCGAVAFYDWSRNIVENADVFEEYAELLTVRTPQVDTAIFFPATSHRLCPGQSMPEPFWEGAADIRRVLDFDVVDERLIADGALAGYRVLIIFGTDVVEAETIAGITAWVEAGGAVLLDGVGPVRTVEGDRAPYDALAGMAPESGMVETGPAPIEVRHDVFLQHLAATEHCIVHRGYTGLSGDAEILAASGDGNAVVWQCRHGDGTAIVCAGDWGERRVYYEIIRDAVYNLSALAPSFRDAPAYNDHWDDCFSTVTEDGIIFLNLEPVAVEKTAFGRTLSIEPNAIAIISADVPG